MTRLLNGSICTVRVSASLIAFPILEPISIFKRSTLIKQTNEAIDQIKLSNVELKELQVVELPFSPTAGLQGKTYKETQIEFTLDMEVVKADNYLVKASFDYPNVGDIKAEIDNVANQSYQSPNYLDKGTHKVNLRFTNSSCPSTGMSREDLEARESWYTAKPREIRLSVGLNSARSYVLPKQFTIDTSPLSGQDLSGHCKDYIPGYFN